MRMRSIMRVCPDSPGHIRLPRRASLAFTPTSRTARSVPTSHRLPREERLITRRRRHSGRVAPKARRDPRMGAPGPKRAPYELAPWHTRPDLVNARILRGVVCCRLGLFGLAGGVWGGWCRGGDGDGVG